MKGGSKMKMRQQQAGLDKPPKSINNFIVDNINQFEGGAPKLTNPILRQRPASSYTRVSNERQKVLGGSSSGMKIC